LSGLVDFGLVENSKEGAAIVAREMYYGNPVVFAWSHNGFDCQIFLVAASFKVLGCMPYGGQPNGRVYVAVYGKGCHHFSETDIYPDYWEEKLGLDELAAKEWAKFWTMVVEEKKSLNINHTPNLVRLRRRLED
jgi:hypothetical protein